MFKRKQKQEQVTIDNGNGKQPELIANADKARETLLAIENQKNQQFGQLDKYIIIESLSDPSKLKFHTELEKDEIDILDNNEMWCDLAPIVFSSADAEVKKIVDIIRGHGTEHRTNKVSFKRKRELSIVYAVKADIGVPSVENKVKSVMGIRT